MNPDGYIEILEQQAKDDQEEIAHLKVELQKEKEKVEHYELLLRVMEDKLKKARATSRKNELHHGKTVRHLQKARRDKKALQERLESSEKDVRFYYQRSSSKEQEYHELFKKSEDVQERYDEAVVDATQLKFEVQELEKQNSKWETVYDRMNERINVLQNTLEGIRAEKLVAERELGLQKTDTLNLVRMLSIMADE